MGATLEYLPEFYRSCTRANIPKDLYHFSEIWLEEREDIIEGTSEMQTEGIAMYDQCYFSLYWYKHLDLPSGLVFPPFA
ncbi:hypothetical protein JCGZ_09930 [Jatropha curcas]|uniref:Uncharacterized protein n=1 Tax=Jatropha curcas TaxID=180498 RepID=A0A067KLR8_JATCU|nr:hypothetical protein JCGZ_09930 [Jatropha curcas]